MSAYSSAPSRASQPAVTKRMRDESGASIVIALVFFLICGIVGSAVLTAASVEAKSVHTHKELQQAELTVGSAAQLLANQLGGDAVRITVAKAADGKVTASVDGVTSPFGQSYWTETQAAAAATGTPSSDTYQISVQPPGDSNSLVDTVYVKIELDADRNLTVTLSLDESFAPSSPYNMTMYCQCIPTYDAKGQLKEFTYEPAVIRKAAES